MQNILITGSNRGIGLAIVKEYLKRDSLQIFAACRNPDEASDLQNLGQKHPHLHIIQLDVSDEASIAVAVQAVSKVTDKLEVLINNAGIYPKSEASANNFGDLDAQQLERILRVNSVAPVMLTQAFLPLLKKAENAKALMVSSRLGSITLAGANGFAYRMSKAALNMGTKIIAQNLLAEGISVITTHPGHVATDMGGAGAPINPVESAQALIALLDKLKPEDAGKFFNYTGEELPW